MGFLDWILGGKRKDDAAVSPAKAASMAAKWSDRAADKRAQNYDRQEALNALAGMGSVEAAAALIRRFVFTVDPSIIDQEEKEVAFNGILKAGKPAIEPIRVFAAKAESLAWPLRLVRSLLTDEEYVEEVLFWLSKMDIEYSKFGDPKLQVLTALEEVHHPSITAAVERFLEDVTEPARFQAIATMLAQGVESSMDPLMRVLIHEESFRIRNKIIESCHRLKWAVPEAYRADIEKVLPPGYSLDASGHFQKGS